jgi:hypothetical protein
MRITLAKRGVSMIEDANAGPDAWLQSWLFSGALVVWVIILAGLLALTLIAHRSPRSAAPDLDARRRSISALVRRLGWFASALATAAPILGYFTARQVGYIRAAHLVPLAAVELALMATCFGIFFAVSVRRSLASSGVWLAYVLALFGHIVLLPLPFVTTLVSFSD